MKSPTKRIFYHLEVTRGTFDTEMPIRARLHTLPARRSNHPRTSAHVTSTSQQPSAHACACYQHVVVPARTCPPASLPSVRAGRTKKPGSRTLPGF